MKFSSRPIWQFSVILGALLSFGCKEIPPFIDFSEGPIVLRDTTYVTGGIPAKEYKNVLIEDISGVRCVNCPSASETAKQLLSKYENQVFLATLHPLTLRQYTTPHTGYDTLSTEEAEYIMQNILGTPTGLPAGAVNRQKFEGEDRITMAHTSWEKYCVDEMAEFSPIALECDLIKGDTASKAIVKTKTTAVEVINRPLSMTIMILESDIKSKQSTPTGYDENYKHSYVLRGTLTPYNGIVLSQALERGRVYEKDFEVSLNDKWVPQNCSLLIILHHNDAIGKEVVQVTKLDF